MKCNAASLRHAALILFSVMVLIAGGSVSPGQAQTSPAVKRPPATPASPGSGVGGSTGTGVGGVTGAGTGSANGSGAGLPTGSIVVMPSGNAAGQITGNGTGTISGT